jgi:nucleoid-associated protein YgaU
MTSDAKIGLLLGLVFIFIIAFIINGLPKFRSGPDNNELTTNMVSYTNEPPGIADRERKAQQALDLTPLEKLPTNEAPAPLAQNPDIRAIVPVPQSISETIEPNTVIPITPRTETMPPVTPAAEKAVVEEPKRVQSAWPKTYVVQTNDNLGDIAKKFYGPELGNKKASVDRIFEANRGQLTSPDEIYVGQKLVIPAPLAASTSAESKPSSVLSGPMFEKVESVGRKPLSSDSGRGETSRLYVVKDGDSLWKIAAEQLGNASRYKEIVKLNPGIISDENDLDVGTRLRLPAR